MISSDAWQLLSASEERTDDLRLQSKGRRDPILLLNIIFLATKAAPQHFKSDIPAAHQLVTRVAAL